MTTTIVIDIKPFVLEQQVYVLQGDEVNSGEKVRMKTLAEDVIMLSEKYNTREFHISGAKVFTKGLKQKIQKAEIEKYSVNKLNITLI
mgnify:FL=1